jgi:CheY-like chemotaxis protein
LKTLVTAATPAKPAEHTGRSGERPGRQSLSRSASATSSAALRGHETVLVVSDAAAMTGIIAKPLRRLGYHVLEALNALEAQRLAELEPKIDLLLVDLSLPETNLIDLAAWIHATYRRTKVLIASSSFWEINAQLGVLRAVSLLAKPFSERELASILRRILD